MKLLALALIAASVAGGSSERGERRRRDLPPHGWKVLLNNPVENALTGEIVQSVNGSLLAKDSDYTETGRRKRIISGQRARAGEYTMMCSLQERSFATWYHICGAVVYNERTIITAAHCVDGTSASSLRVRCGEFNLRRSEGTEQTIGVDTVLMNPDYRDDGNDGFPNDVALLELQDPLTFDDYVQPATIDDGTGSLASTCKLLGWGRTALGTLPDTLRDVSIRRMTNVQCGARWIGAISDIHICFRDVLSYDSSCNGDSGGPAICGNKVVGVTSWGSTNCVGLYYPSVYARLSQFYGWIVDNAF